MNYYKFYSEKKWVNEIIKNILLIANSSIKNKGSFEIVLTGGETPRSIYRQLALINKNWENWNFWISDERFENNIKNNLNSAMIFDELFSKITLDQNQIHFIDTNLTFFDAIDKYKNELKKVFLFDLVILGIGEDGHTASLFPDNFIGDDKKSDDVIAVMNSPKPPANRISISANKLSNNQNLFFLVNGEKKYNIIYRFLNNDTIPCNKIKSKNDISIFYYTK